MNKEEKEVTKQNGLEDKDIRKDADIDSGKYISIREMIETLINGKNTLIFFTIVAILISGIGSFGVRFFKREAKVVIGLNFSGIDKGLNPDGTKYDPSFISSPEVIVPAIASLGMQNDGIDISKVRAGMAEEPIVPDKIVDITKKKLEDGMDYQYFPTEYEVSLKGKNAKPAKANRLLNAIIDSYTKVFMAKYSDEAMIANTIKKIDYENYDYPELTMIMKNQIDLMQSYLQKRIKEAPDFRSSSTGMSFADIDRSLAVFNDVDINKMSSIISSYNLTKDMNKLILNYQYRIKRYNLSREKKQSEESITKNMIKSYDRQNNTLLVPGMTDNNGVEIGNEDKYYDSLVDRATNSGVDAANIIHERDYLQNEIKILSNDKVNPATKEAMVKDVVAQAKTLQKKMNDWIDIIQKTADDYYNMKYAKAIVKLSPVSITSPVDIKKNIVLGGVVGLVFGGFVVFFKKYWEDTSKED